MTATNNGPKDFAFPNRINNFLTYDSSRDKTNVNEAAWVRGSYNVYKKINGNVGNRCGLKRRGTADSTLAGVDSEFVWRTSWGDTLPLWVANGKLQVEINTGTDTYQWTTIATTAQTRWVFDAWWDNTLKKNKVIACNGTANLYSWSGGITQVASTTINTITKTGTATWNQDHFESTGGAGNVVINGTTYAYTGGAGTTTLTGVTPNPTGEAVNSYVVDALVTSSNKPAASYAADFLRVVNNRTFVGSYTSQLVYISSSTDFTNYTIPASIIPGSPNLLTLDGIGKGITVKSGNALVSFGTDGWVEVTFPTYTDATGVLLEQITPKLLPVQSLGAAYAHELIDTSGDNVIYLSQDQQVRYLGNTNNSFFTVFPSLSQSIYTELQEEDFTNAQLNCIGDYIYLTAPNSGKTYIYQARQSIDMNTNVVAERLWYAPFIWSASRVDEIDGQVVVFSSQNPQVYYGWDTEQFYDDSPSDEELPYDSILAFAYRQHGDRTRLKEFDKLFTEGYMTTGTNLNALINYEYNGSEGRNYQVINNVDLPADFYTVDPQPLGQSPFGQEPLGDSIIDPANTLPKFRNIKSLSLKNCFEYQIIYYSNDSGSQWEIETTATNADYVTKQNPTYLISKPTP